MTFHLHSLDLDLHMKRAVNNPYGFPEAGTSTQLGSGLFGPSVNPNHPTKRYKTYRACVYHQYSSLLRNADSKNNSCTSCRHHKTRCESGQEYADGSNACRRCRHLSKQCSLEDSPVIATVPTNGSNRLSTNPYLEEEEDSTTIQSHWRINDTSFEPRQMGVDEFTASVMKSFSQYTLRFPTQDPLRQSARTALGPLIRLRTEISETLEWGRALEAIRAVSARPNTAINFASYQSSDDPQELKTTCVSPPLYGYRRSSE